jgi:hypothetical protein
MGLLDKVKGILFDETEEDENVEELPKREPKKTKSKPSFIDYDKEEDTIKEVKVDYSKEERSNFPVDDFEPVSRTRSGLSDFDSFVEPVKETHETQREIPREVPRERTLERPTVQQRPVQSVPQRVSTPVEHHETRSRYELPPKKEVVHEQRDYRKLLDDAKNTEKKPFVVTPIISPVYGIIDKNYKPEEIIEKNKPVQIDQVRERMFGPVSYSDEAIPEPVKYEESTETLTDKLRQENQKQIEKEELEPVSEFDDFDTREVEISNDNYVEEEPQQTYEEKTSPSLDISDLINEAESNDYNTRDYGEDYFKSTPSDYEPEEVEIKAEPRKENVKESLDDTIETDLFNLIDSMYKTDERE